MILSPFFRIVAIGFCASVVFSLARAAEDDNVFLNGNDPTISNRVSDPKFWQEQQSSLPPWPQDQALVPVRLGGAEQSFDYFIDAASLKTGRDGVVRFTLVAESRSGARNLSFEGLRCSPSGHYRVYAYGYDGKFEPSNASPDWLPIDHGGMDQIHQELWANYLCSPGVFQPRPHKDQLKLLKNGRVSRSESQGFLTY